MDHHGRAVRTGTAAILCALILRLGAAGVPEKVLAWLKEPNTAAFLIYLETGRDVRFSASGEVFWEYAPESAQPILPVLAPDPEEPALPVFTPDDTALTDMFYGCDLRPDLENLLTRPLSWDLADGVPRVLILSTHTTESYTQGPDSYVESSQYRTLDENHNMLSIGQLVATILSENGIAVIQDKTLHDYPSYNGSYNHARKSIVNFLEEYPTIQLILDLHRDAADMEVGQLRTVAQVDGQTSAQLMLVMGTDESGLTHENWKENLALALKLQAQLERQAPGITRPTYLRAQRFNQDLSPGALLVEVGAAGNTHQEALTAVEVLAQAIADLKKGAETPAT